MANGDPSAKQPVPPVPTAPSPPEQHVPAIPSSTSGHSGDGNATTSSQLPSPRDLTPHDLLREMRVEIQALQSLFENVRSGMLSFTDYKGWMMRRKDHMDSLLTIAEHLLDAPPPDTKIPSQNLRGRMAAMLSGSSMPTGQTRPAEPVSPEIICYVRALWEEIKACPLLLDTAGTPDAQQLQRQLTLLEDQCGKLVFTIGYEVIPEEINGWLKVGWPGYYVSFHTAFNDELPDQGDRVKMLTYFAQQPRTIKGGIVDVGTGLIYNYSLSRFWQAVTALLAVGAFLGTGGALYSLAGVVGQVLSLPLPTATSAGVQLLTLWMAILAGVVLHIVVATAKLMKTQPGSPPVLSFTTLFPMINAKLGSILFKLLITLIGLFGLLVASKTPVTMLNAFLAGYSIDSIVELFATSAEQQASAYVTTMQKDLGVTTSQ